MFHASVISLFNGQFNVNSFKLKIKLNKYA